MSFLPNKRLSLPWLLVLIGLVLITGCERPDPQDAAADGPTQTPTTAPSPTVRPTTAPMQLYVVIVQPTADPFRPQVAAGEGVLAGQAPTTPSFTPTPLPPTIPAETPFPTPLPDDYYLGWAWTDSLHERGGQVQVDEFGVILRDRPSSEGGVVGLVVGYGTAVVVGQSRCGYAPVLVHFTDLLSVTTPRLVVEDPGPLATATPLFGLQPTPETNTTSGWAFTQELTVVGETAISGLMGVNLRLEPCRNAVNLGFIPPGVNMIISGPPSGEYTPVRVDTDTIRLPYDISVFPPVNFPTATPVP